MSRKTRLRSPQAPFPSQQGFARNRLAAAILLGLGSAPSLAASNTITLHDGTFATADGTPLLGLKTDTQIAVSGNVTDITTNTVRGNTGFNSFGHFQVGAGNTVNLHVPGSAQNLVNLVHDSKVVINGTLNGLKDGKIGGNIIFADPHGLVVGASGVVNVGSLTVTTPSTQQMTELAQVAAFGSDAAGSATAEKLKAGEYNGAGGLLGPEGAIEIRGAVNSNGAINLFGAKAAIELGASLQAGTEVAQQVFASTVNTEGVALGAGVARQDGSIRIVASDSATVGGELAAMMADTRGGAVFVSGGAELELKGSARIASRGATGKDSGNVVLEARKVTVRENAQVVTRATGGGRSGNIAVNALSDASCTLCTGAASDIQTLDELVAETAAGASSPLSPEVGKASVVIEKGALLDAGHADGTKAGDINVFALGFSKQFGGYSAAEASIDVAGVLKGRDISLRAQSQALIDPTIFGALLDTDSLKADITRLTQDNNWTEEEAWSNVVDSLLQPVQNIAKVDDITKLGLDPADFSELVSLLPFLSVSIADASAKVTVQASADLIAQRNLTLAADSVRSVTSETWAIPVINGLIPFNSGVAFGRLSGVTAVEVKAGAELVAGQDLAIRAHSDNTLEVSAETTNGVDAEGKQVKTAGFSFAMANTDLDTHVKVNDGVSLAVGRDLDVLALTEQSIENKALFKATGDGALGGVVFALSVLHSDTEARFDADLSGARDFTLSAANLVAKQESTAESQAGKSLLDFLKFRALGTIDPIKNFLMSKVKTVSETQATDSDFRLAGSLGMVIADHSAEAVIGKGAQLSLDGDLSVVALQEQLSQYNAAQSTVNGSSRGQDQNDMSISLAIAFGLHNQDTRALVEDGAVISANRIGIDARYRQPIRLSGLDRWSSLSDVGSNLLNMAKGAVGGPNGIAALFANQYANSQGTSDELGIAGSVSILFTDLDTQAWVGDDVVLTARATGAGASKPFDSLPALTEASGDPDPERQALRDRTVDWEQPVTVRAENELGQLAIAGNVGMLLFGTTVGTEPKAPDGDEGNAVGGALNVQTLFSNASAGIGANSRVTAEGLQVVALQDDLVLTLSPSAGKGVSAAANGALVASSLTSTVNASIHQSATITADRVRLQAEHQVGLWSAAGGVALGGTTGVGGGLALNVLTTDVHALVGNNLDYRPETMGPGYSPATRGAWKVNTLDVSALSSGQSGAFAIAGAVAKGADKEEQEAATSKHGDIGKPVYVVATSLGQSIAQSLTMGNTAIADALEAAKSGATSVKDTLVEAPEKLKGAWESFKKLFSGGGSSEQGEGLSIAAAGSLSLNVSGQKSRAHLGDIVLDPRDPPKGGSKVTVLALNQTHQFSGSGAGALTLAGSEKKETSSALSGAIAFNHLFNVTEAQVKDATLRGNDVLEVSALSGGDQIAMGLGLAVAAGGEQNNVAVALSASGGYIGNTTAARVVDSTVTQRAAAPGRIEVTSYDRSRILLGGGSFAGSKGSGASVGGSLVLGVLNNTLASEWLGSLATDFADFAVSANSASRVLAGAVAGAVAATSKEDSGAGAVSLALVVLNNRVKARIDQSDLRPSVLAGGDVGVLARSVTGLSTMDAAFDAAADTTLASLDLDLDGSRTARQLEQNTQTDQDLLDGAADSDATTPHNLFSGELAGEAVLAVAGSLAATGGNGAGAGSLAVVYAGSEYQASIANSGLSLTGDLAVAAYNNTDAIAAAIGGAGSSKVAANLSGTVLVGRGKVEATLDMYGRTLTADSVRVAANNSGGFYSLAGSIAGSSGAAAVGGALALNDTENQVRAEISRGIYQVKGDVALDAGQQSRIIAVALSGAAGTSNAAVSGALTYNRIDDTTQALLKNATLSARNLRLDAAPTGTRADIWSLAGNFAITSGAAGVGAAVAVNILQADRTASVTGSQVTLEGGATLRSALKGEIWGVALDAAGGNNAAVGGSIMVNVIDGQDRVSIENSELTTTGVAKALSLDAAGDSLLRIASLAGSVSGSGTAAVGGALSINRIGANRTALIAGSKAIDFATVGLKAGGDQDIYAIAVAGGGSGNVAVQGSSTSNVLEGTERAAVENSTVEGGSLTLSAAEGDRTIWSLAGAVNGAGTVAVGVANANNIILAKRQAEVTGSTVKLRAGLSLSAGGASAIRSAAVGGGGAGTAAVGASVAINVIEGEESARLKDSTVTAGTVTVEVLRGGADIKTLAGNVQGAGTGAGAGAIAVSTIGQARRASIEGSALTASDAVRVQAITHGNIDTVAISGAGAGTAAAAFSNTSNNIAARTQARVEGSGGSAGTLSILASDDSAIHAGSGGVAGAGTAAVGGATAINRVDSRIEASLTGNRGSGWALNNLVLGAHSASEIISAALSAGAAANAAVTGVIATNVVQTQAKAHIGDGAQVVAQRNVGVSARNLDTILGSAVSLAASGNAAVSALATVNLVESLTEAWIDGSTTRVSALARDTTDTLLIDSGALKNAPADDRQWISGEQFNPMPDLGIEQHRVTGLAVQASSVQQIGQLSVSAALAVIPLYSAAVSGVGNSSVVAGATRAYIKDAAINQAAGAGNAQDVRVGAHGHSFVVGYLGAIAGGPSAASVSGSLDSTVISRQTEAYLRGVTLRSLGATQVLAGSSQYATSVAATFSAAIVGIGGTANVTVLKGDTQARVEGGSRLDVGSLAVKATALQRLTPNLVTVAGGGVAVGGALATVYNQSVTRAWVGSDLAAASLAAGARTTVQGGAVNIEASNSTALLQTVGSAGGGLATVGGSVGIAVVETTTEAGASQADFGSAGARVGAVAVKATDTLSLTSTVGSAQVGALSVGGSANVLVLNSANRALLDRSTLYSSGDVSLQARREGTVKLNTITGSLGVAGVAGSLGLLLIGPGAVTVSAEGETVNPLDELDRGGNGSLSQSNRDGGAQRVGYTSYSDNACNEDPTRAACAGGPDRADSLGYRDYRLNPSTGRYELVETFDTAAGSRLNTASATGMGSRLSDTAVNRHETVARLGDSVVDTTGALRVSAEDRLSAYNLAGNAVVGVANAMGAALAFTLSNARVAADLLGGSVRAGSLAVTARSLALDATPAVQVQAVSGSGSLNGALGAAIGVAVVNNVTASELTGTVTVSEALSVRAEDTQDVSVQSYGVAVGALAGAGLVLGVAAHDSQAAVTVAAGATLDARDIDLVSRSQAAVTLTGRGAGGGVGAGLNATVLVARDQSAANLTVGGALRAQQSLALTAEVNPHVAATSEGIAIGGLAAAGGSLAIALAKASANLVLGPSALLQARTAVLASRIGLNGGRDSATVKAAAVAGGFGVSVNAAVATASNQSAALLRSEETARFVGLGNGDWSFAASTSVRQRAAAEGYSGALLALGATVSEAAASTLTRALVGGRFSGDIGKLSISAYGSADNLATTKAGQGGLVSGAAAVATTRDTSLTQARLYIRGADGLAQAEVGALSLGAHYQAVFNSFADSINAALLGASGARASNVIDATTVSELASGSRLQTLAYEQSARTDVTKADSDAYNVKSGSGGVIDAAAALSSTLVTVATRADIGSQVKLTLAGDWRAPQHLRVHAFNNLSLRDKVKLDSGGAIAIAAAESLIEVASAAAQVNVGTGSQLYSVGDIVLSASGYYDLQAQANAKTWGLAGAAQGRSLASVDADYDVAVGNDATLFSYGDAKFYAGYDVTGTMNKAVLTARTDLWNNTAFPVVTDPEADAVYLRDSHLRLGSGSHVRSVGDIYAYAGKGYSVLTGAGIGKDLYREAASAILGAIVGEVSLDIKAGSARNGGTAVVTANGTLDAGVYSRQTLKVTGLRYLLNGVEVDLANLPANPSGTLTVEPILAEISDGISYRMVRGEYSQLINARIADLKKQLTDYGLSAQERTAFQAELNLLNQTLATIYRQMGGDPATGTLPAQLPVWILEVDPILARPGNILVQGDALVGSGALNAPGDARIEIVNESAAFLSLLGLEIPDREGGQLLFNGAKMLGNANIAAANLAGQGTAAFSVTVAENSPAPSIVVKNTYNPATGKADAAGLRAPAPDINVNGVIANKRGSIDLTASYGSIYTNADVRGQTLRISAGQNFVLNNPNAFTHIGGDPATNNAWGYLTGPAAGSGVVAGNNVVISALYLNLNGLVQSGVANWSVNIHDGHFANLDALRAAYQNGTGAAVVQLVSTDARTGTVGFSYDFRSESILLDNLQVGGGYMELTGQIVSTGNGQLRVLDGFSQVSIVNNTTRNLNISGIDLGTGVEGTLKINDVGRHASGEVWSTIYTYNNGQVLRYEGRSNEVQTTGAYLKAAIDGRNASYQTVNGRTYVWLTGRDTTDTATKVEYWDAFWGFIPTGDGTQLSYQVQKGAATAIDGAEYMGSLSNAYRIDYARLTNDALAAFNAGDLTRFMQLTTASWDSSVLEPYRVTINSGEVLGQQDQRYATNGAEVIDQYMGGYCKVHFIWCQVYRTTRTTVTQQGFKEIDRYTVRADSPVSVSFIGYDAGSLSLSSNGNVTLLGSLYNQSGSTTLSVAGNLAQANDSVVIAARDVTLSAGGSLGDAAQALRVQVGNNLSAYSSQGSIFLQGINGGVNLTRLEAANGNVQLAAQGNITAAGQVVVRGRSIDLHSTHGSLGSAGQWLNLDTGSHGLDSPALLTARAVGDIYVEEVSGDLWVDRIAAGGNVGVKVRNGDLLDGNSQLAYDERSLAQLRDLWAAMGLTGSQADEALAQQRAVLVEAGNYDYARYWRLRNLAAAQGGGWTADAFDANQALLNAAQIAQLTELGWSAAQIAEEQATRVADYQALHQRFGGADYDAHYQYQLSAEDQAQLGRTAAWTEDQLRFSIAASLLNRGSGSTAVDEAMNIEGRDVTLIANRIGRLLDDDVVIDLSQGAAALTQAQRAALAGAEQDDLYFDEHNPLLIRIAQRDDVNVTASGLLTVTAQGDVFLGGEQDFNLFDVRGDSIRIKTDGNIESANGNNLVIRGHDVVLEAANGAIGGQGALNLAVTGSLTARGNYLNLVHHGDLSIQRLTGLNGLDLRVLGHLRSASQLGENLLGGDINLSVSGDVGSADARVQIGTDGVDERVNLDIAGDAWLGALQGVAAQPGVLRVDEATVGGVLDIGQARDLLQDGDWSLRGLVLDLTGNWTMAEGRTLVARDGLFARVSGAVRLADVEALGSGADLDIEALSLASVADGNRWLAADAVRLLASGDIGSAARALVLGAQTLAVDSTAGALYLELLGGTTAGTLLSAGQQRILTHGDLALTRIESRTGDLSLGGSGELSVDEVSAGGHIDMLRDAALRLGNLIAGGDWTLDGQSAVIDTATVGGNAELTLSGALELTSLDVTGNWTLDGQSAVIDTATVGGAASMTLGGRLDLGSLAAGGRWTLQGTEAAIGEADVTGQVGTTLSGDLTLGRLTGQQGWTLAARDAAITSATLVGDVAHTLSGALHLGELVTEGNWTLDGRSAVIDTATVGGAASMTLAGALELSNLDVTGNWTLDGQSAVIDTATVGGNAELALSGALELTSLDVTGNWTLDGQSAVIDSATVGGNAELTLAGDLALGSLDVTGNWTLDGQSAVIDTATVGGNAELTLAGDLQMANLDVTGNWTLDGQSAVIDTATVGGDASMTLAGALELGSLAAGGRWTLQGTEATVGEADVTGQVGTTLSGDLTLGRLTGQQGWSLAARDAAITSATLVGDVAQTLSGALHLGELVTEGNWTLDGRSAVIDTATVGGAASMTLAGALELGNLDVTGDWTLDGQSAVIDTATVDGNAELTLAGALALGNLDVTGNWTLDGQSAVIDSAIVGSNAELTLSGALALGSLDVTGDWILDGQAAVIDTATVDGNAELTLSGALELTSLDVTGNWTLDVQSAVIDTATVGGNAELTLSGALALGSLDVTGDWTLDGQSAEIDTATVDGNASMTLAGALALGSLDVTGDWTLDGQSAEIDTATVGGDASMTLAGALELGSLAAGGRWTLQGTEAAIGEADVTGQVGTALSGDLTLGRLTGQQGWALAARDAAITSATLVGDVAQTLSGALHLGELVTEGNWTLDGRSAVIDTATVGGAASMTLAGALELSNLDVTGNWTLDGQSAVIDTATVGGNAELTLAGDLQMAVLGTAGDARLVLGTGSALGRLAVDGDLLLRVAGLLDLAEAEVSGAARLQHDGAAGDRLRYGRLQVGDTLAVEGRGDWVGETTRVTGNARFAVGSAELGMLESLTGTLSLAADGLFDADELHSRQRWLDLVAGQVRLGNVSAADTLTVHSGSDLTILTGRSGGDLSLTTEAGSLGTLRFGTPADPADPSTLVPAHLKSDTNLLVQTDGDVFGGNAEADLELRLIGRNLSFGRAQSLMEDIFLQAGGDADQGHGNITGLVVEATRDVGIIANGDLNMPKVVYGRNYSLKAGRDLTVGIGGNLDISGIAEAGRDLRFEIGGVVDLQGVKAGRNVSIRSGQYINIDEAIEAGGNILLEALNGDITVGQGIRSTGQDSYNGMAIAGNVVLNASGAVSTPLIEAANGFVSVTGQQLLLGDIQSAQRVDLLSRGLIQVQASTSGGDQRWQAEEEIRFRNLLAGGQALLDSLLDTRGGRLEAAQGATLHAGVRGAQVVPSSIRLDAAVAPTLSLWAGDLVRVGDLAIGRALDVHARSAELYGRHTGAGQLDLWVEGSRDGAIAERLRLNLAASRLLSPRLYVADSEIVTTASAVDLQDARGVDRLWLDTAQAKIRLDNASPGYLADADVQLYEHDKAFHLQQDALVTRTDAYVLHRKVTHQVLVPNFTETRENAQGIEYQGISAARYAQQMSAPGFTAARLGEIVRTFGLPPLPSLQWTPSWVGQPVEMQINLDLGANGAPTYDAHEVAQWSL